MFGQLAALLAAAPGCQPTDTTTDSQPSASAEPAPQGVNDEPTQPGREANEANTSGLIRDNASRAPSDEDRGAAAYKAETPSIPDAAAVASQRLSPQQHYEAGVVKEQAGNSSEAIAHYTTALELDPDFAAA